VFGGGLGGIFEEFLGGGRRNNPMGPEPGADLRYNLQITFEEAFHGADHELGFNKLDVCQTCSGSGSAPGTSLKSCGTCRGAGQVTMTRGFFAIRQPCPTCHGRGSILEKACESCRGEGRVETHTTVRVRVPPGVDEGIRLRSMGNGEGGVRGGPPGDLYVAIHVKPHEFFTREGDDLFCEVPITFPLAVLGGELDVPTPHGREKRKIPAGTQNGTLFKLKGKGMPHLEGKGHGDLVVRVTIEVPTHLTGEQKKKIHDIAAFCDGNVNPVRKSFMEKVKEFFK
jgi:molecular chaperone DnaJ